MRLSFWAYLLFEIQRDGTYSITVLEEALSFSHTHALKLHVLELISNAHTMFNSNKSHVIMPIVVLNIAICDAKIARRMKHELVLFLVRQMGKNMVSGYSGLLERQFKHSALRRRFGCHTRSGPWIRKQNF
jgi:hypothetical protein